LGFLLVTSTHLYTQQHCRPRDGGSVVPEWVRGKVAAGLAGKK
jgi:hypothetical protein